MDLPTTIKIARRTGFTLMEIMLALLVVMVGIVAITGLLGSSLESASKAHADLDISGFADMVLNHYQAEKDWNAIPPSNSENLSIPDYGGSAFKLQKNIPDQFTSQVPGFAEKLKETYTVTYLFQAKQTSPRVKELTLDVWPGHNTNTPPLTFHTEIYNWIHP
jgi:type II secretory pathway pseudopilin PulG